MDVRPIIAAGLAAAAIAVGVTSGRALTHSERPAPAPACRSWAPRVEEDQVPYDHDGAPLVAYDGDGAGCGGYADGARYDGLGWAP